jgi:hypothetical protein
MSHLDRQLRVWVDQEFFAGARQSAGGGVSPVVDRGARRTKGGGKRERDRLACRRSGGQHPFEPDQKTEPNSAAAFLLADGVVSRH